MDRSQILKGSILCLSGPLVRFSRPETLKTLPNEKKSTKPSNFQTRFLYVPICQVVSDISPQMSRFRVKMTCWADIHFKFDLKSFFGTQSVHSDHKTTFRALDCPICLQTTIWAKAIEGSHVPIASPNLVKFDSYWKPLSGTYKNRVWKFDGFVDCFFVGKCFERFRARKSHQRSGQT